MIKTIPGTLAAPAFESQDEKNRVASLLNVIVLSSLLGAVLYFPFASAGRQPFIVLAMVLSLAVWLSLKRGYVRAAALAMVVGLFALFIAIIYTGGGLRAPAFSGLIINILFAGILLGRKAAVRMMVLSILYGVVLFRMDSLGLLPSPVEYSSSGYLIIETVFFLMTGVILSLSLQLIRDAFDRAHRDLEERKLAEQAFRDSEERFIKAFHSSPAAIILTRVADSVFIEANRSFEMLVGFEREKIIGHTPFELNMFPDPGIISWIRERLVNDGMLRNFEMVIQTKSGERRQVLFSSERISLEEQAHYVTTIIDISDRKQAETALRENEARLQSIIDNEPECVKVLDLDGRLLEMNPAGLAMIEADSLEHVLGHQVAELALEEHRVAFTRLTRSVSSGRSGSLVFEIEGLKGTHRWLETHAVPLRDVQGTIIALLGITRDITDRKRAEEALENRERYFRALIENNTDAIAVVSREGKILYQSPSSLKTLGIDPADLASREVFAFIHPDDKLKGVGLFTQLAQNPGKPVTAELRYRHKDQLWHWVEATGTNLFDDPGVNGIVVNYRDITERKLAEQQIQRQIQHLNALRMIDMAISSSFDVRITLSILLDQVISQLGIDAADLLLFNPATQQLEYAGARGFHSTALQYSQLHLGEGFAGRAIRERRIIHIPVIAEAGGTLVEALTQAGELFVSYFGVPLIAKGQVEGVLEIFHRSLLTPSADWLGFLEALASQAAIAINNARLYQSLQDSNFELIQAYDATIAGWSHALDLRDKETEGHTLRVTEMTTTLARKFNFTDEQLRYIRWGSLLHDIGKMGVPDRILLKPEALTAEEWDSMRNHPTFAYEMLAPIAHLRPALDIPYCHHERWDGSGYPRGLQGESIPLPARLFAVVDVWDALRSDRPYRNAWSVEKTSQHIRSLSGTHFDPKVVEPFLEIVEAQNRTGRQ